MPPPPPPLRLGALASSSSSPPSSLSPRHPFVRANSSLGDDGDDDSASSSSTTPRRGPSASMASSYDDGNGRSNGAGSSAQLPSSSMTLRPSSRGEVRGVGSSPSSPPPPVPPTNRRDSSSSTSNASMPTSGHFFEPLLQQLTDVRMPMPSAPPKDKSSLEIDGGSNDGGDRCGLYPSASSSTTTTFSGPSRTSTPFTDAGAGDAVISIKQSNGLPRHHHTPSWATPAGSVDGASDDDVNAPSSKWPSFFASRSSKGYHRVESNVFSPKSPSGYYPGRPWQPQTRFSLAMLKSPRSQLLPYMRRSLETCLTSYHPAKVILALLFIAAFIASTTLFIIFILNPDKQPKPWRTFCAQQQPFPHAVADSLAPVDVIMGVMTVDSKFDRRSVIRQTYARHTRPIDPVTGEPLANVQVKFVLGRPRKQFARRIALEMEMYNDIVILDIKENQGAGKTQAWFQWAAENGTVPILRPSASNSGNYDVAWKRADYVGKADDDAFIVLSELERHLRVAPRKLTYWGYLIKDWFMGGEAYVVSSDLVDYIATSPMVAAHNRGKEDTQTARWMRQHPRAHEIHYVSERCFIYDHPKAGTAYSHGYLFPEEVAKIRLEGQHGVPDHIVKARGGPAASQWYSTVSTWHKRWQPRKKGMSVEEELESLVEGGGLYTATGWQNGEPKPSVDRHQVVFESDDQRLHIELPRKSPSVASTSARLMEGWRLSQDSHLTIYAPFNDSSTSHRRHGLVSEEFEDEEEDDGDAVDEVTEGSEDEPRAPTILEDLPLVGALKHLAHISQDDESQGRETEKRQRVPWAEHQQMGRTRSPRLPRPYPATSLPLANGSSIALSELRAQRYMHHGDAARGHMRGGTVVVHYLKRNEWFLETALLLIGKDRVRGDAAGGAWTMWGSPRALDGRR